jgi:hypothetical protein
MRVALSIPAPARLTTGSLIASSTDDDALLEILVRRDAIDPVVGTRRDARTHDGWPFTLALARTATGQRVAAMYRFGAWRGYVLVELDDTADDALADAWNAASVGAVEEALCTASPDWRGDGEVHCIAELFE